VEDVVDVVDHVAVGILSAMAFCPKVLPFPAEMRAGRDGHDEAQPFALAEFKVFRAAGGRYMHDAGAFVFADIFPRDAVARCALVHLLLQLDVIEWPAVMQADEVATGISSSTS
jgi:hypothetical protein